MMAAATLWQAKRDFNQAERLYRLALQHEPDHVPAMNYLGNLLYRVR